MYEEHMMQGWAETGELLQKENEIKKNNNQNRLNKFVGKKV